MRFFNVIFLISIFMALPVMGGVESDNSSEDIEVPMPVGIPINGLKIPLYDELGNEVMLLNSKLATKVDEQSIAFEHLKIRALDENGDQVFVEVPRSVFNVKSRILSGDQGAKIHREDFIIHGDSIEFDTQKKIGRLKGSVMMVVSTENISE